MQHQTPTVPTPTGPTPTGPTDSTRREPNRIIQTIGALGLLGAALWLSLPWGTITSLGCHRQGLSVYLSRGEGAITPDIADRLLAVVDTRNQPLPQEELSAVAEKALTRARDEARARFVDPGSPVVAALEELRSNQIQFEWEPASFDGELVRAGSSAFQSSRENPDVTPLERGKVFFARVQTQVVVWPRKQGVTYHPEILLAQASVSWHSDVAAGAGILAQQLAAVLAENVADKVRTAAATQGLEATR